MPGTASAHINPLLGTNVILCVIQVAPCFLRVDVHVCCTRYVEFFEYLLHTSVVHACCTRYLEFSRLLLTLSVAHVCCTRLLHTSVVQSADDQAHLSAVQPQQLPASCCAARQLLCSRARDTWAFLSMPFPGALVMPA